MLASWRSGANGRRLPTGDGGAMTINELIVAFWPHVEKHYRRADGTKTPQPDNYKRSLRPLKHLYGDRPTETWEGLPPELGAQKPQGTVEKDSAERAPAGIEPGVAAHAVHQLSRRLPEHAVSGHAALPITSGSAGRDPVHGRRQRLEGQSL